MMEFIDRTLGRHHGNMYNAFKGYEGDEAARGCKSAERGATGSAHRRAKLTSP